MEKDQALGLNFETGFIMRGENTLMTLDELLFLLDSAVQYNNMCPIEESEKFIGELRKRIGVGFTPEQFQQIKAAMESGDGFSEEV